MTSAREILAANLGDMMARTPALGTRPLIAAASGVSARTVGYMLQSGRGNPTLGNIELVARAFNVPVWRLLVDSPIIERMLMVSRILEMPGVPDTALGAQWSAAARDTGAAVHEPAPAIYHQQQRRRGK